VTPEVAVEPEHLQPHQAREQEQRQRAQRQLALVGGWVAVEAQQQRQRLRGDRSERLHEQRPDAVVAGEPREQPVERVCRVDDGEHGPHHQRQVAPERRMLGVGALDAQFLGQDLAQVPGLGILVAVQ
jgi:hypothetical protein